MQVSDDDDDDDGDDGMPTFRIPKVPARKVRRTNNPPQQESLQSLKSKATTSRLQSMMAPQTLSSFRMGGQAISYPVDISIAMLITKFDTAMKQWQPSMATKVVMDSDTIDAHGGFRDAFRGTCQQTCALLKEKDMYMLKRQRKQGGAFSETIPWTAEKNHQLCKLVSSSIKCLFPIYCTISDSG